MNAQIQVVLIAAGCTSAVGLIGMGVIWLLRRASLRLSVQVSGAVVVLAVVAGTLGTAEAMFLSPHDLSVVVMVCVVAAVVAAGFGGLLGRQLQASSLALRQAARSLGDQDGGYRSPAGPMTAELAALSRELAETSEKLNGVARAGARAGSVPPPARGLGLARPAHAPGRPARDGRGAGGRHSRRPGPLPPADPRRGRPARPHGGRPVRAFPHTGGNPAPVPRPDRSRRPDQRRPGQHGGTRAGPRRAADRDGPTPRSSSAPIPGRCRASLTNLLVNAIRHTPADGSVHVVAAPQPGGALLAVADGCGGIPEADLARVFDTAWRGTPRSRPRTRTAARAWDWRSCAASSRRTRGR